jgi:hypothetical protein
MSFSTAFSNLGIVRVCSVNNEVLKDENVLYQGPDDRVGGGMGIFQGFTYRLQMRREDMTFRLMSFT